MILFVAGLVLVGVGGAAATAMLWPAAGDAWKSWASTGSDWMANADEATRIPQTTVSWFIVAILALLALIVISAVIVIARLGGGRSGVVIREEIGSGVQGSVTVRHGFAADAITQSLASHDELLTSKVSSHSVRGTDLLHVRVTPRQNVSPAEVAETVTGLVDRLARLMGRDVTTLVTIQSGIRSRLAAEQPRVN